MSRTVAPEPKVFEPGTTGWTASDLDDPVIEGQWFNGRFEIVEGVLTKMPPAYFTGGEALVNLIMALSAHFKQHGPKGSFATEVDMIIDEARVAVADAVYLTAEERVRQDEASRRAGTPDPRRTRILVPPTLVIESVSPGHELHDQRTKRRWYADFGVPNYWILNAFDRSLTCLSLKGSSYHQDEPGGAGGAVLPSAFPDLRIELNQVWGG